MDTPEPARRMAAVPDQNFYCRARLWFKKWWAGLVAVVAVVAINAWSLMRFPPPFVDEAWFASRAWGFVHTGRPFGALDTGVFDRFDSPWIIFPWLPTAIQSLALRLVPEPELWPLRLVSLLFGLLLLGAIFAIALKLYDTKVALLAVCLVSLSWPFLYSSHLARIDIMAAALGFGALALYLNNPAHRFLPGLLSGLCVGAAFEIHPHSVILVPALGALYFYDSRWSMLRRADFWAFAAGGAAGLAFYAAVHILPDPAAYSALNEIAFATTHVPPILTLDLGVIGRAAGEMGLVVAVIYHATLPLAIVAVVFLLHRRSPADRRLRVLLTGMLLAAALLIQNKATYYMILFTPVIDLALAAFLANWASRPWRRRLPDQVARILVLGLLLGGLLVNLSRLGTDTSSFYQTVEDRIGTVVRPGDSILAAQTYWFGLHDHTYYSWEGLVYYRRYAPGSTLEDAMHALRPTVLVLDKHMRDFISDEPNRSPYHENMRVSASQMAAFLAQDGELVDEFEVEHYGLIQIYRLHWDRE